MSVMTRQQRAHIGAVFERVLWNSTAADRFAAIMFLSKSYYQMLLPHF